MKPSFRLSVLLLAAAVVVGGLSPELCLAKTKATAKTLKRSIASFKTDPPEVTKRKNCADNAECLARLNLAIGFAIGQYHECERLNSMVCDATSTDRSKIRCDVTKFVTTVVRDDCQSQPPKDGCYQQTNTVIFGFTPIIKDAPMSQIPYVESESGYRYSCQ